MPVLKTQCPECDAKIRLTVDSIGDHDAECPACGHEFTAQAVADNATSTVVNNKKSEKKSTTAGPAKKSGGGVKDTAKASSAAKKTKASALKRASDEDEDEDEDAPKKKKKKKKGADQDTGKQKLILAGAGALVLVIGGVVAAVLALGGKDKDKTAKTDTPATNTNNALPGPTPPAPTPPAPAPDKDKEKPPVTTPPVVGQNGNNSSNPPPKSEDVELTTTLPPFPVIKLEGSLVPPTTKPVVKPPAIPPLAPDEDPFNRAKGFKEEGKLPDLPPLPARGGRPVLSLESGGHTGFVSKVFFTPDGKKIITVSEDKAVRIWDPTTNETIKTLRFPAGPGKEGMLLGAALSRSGKRLAVGGEPVAGVAPGKIPIFVINPDTGATVTRIDKAGDLKVAEKTGDPKANDAITAMHFSNDGKRLAVGCAFGLVQVFNPDNGSLIGALDTGGTVLEVKFNPLPNTNFVAAIVGTRVLLLDLKTSQQKQFRITADGGTGPGGLPGGPGAAPGGGRAIRQPRTLAWSNDGKYLAVGCTDDVVAVFKSDGTPENTLPPLTVKQKGRVIRADGSETEAMIDVKIGIQQMQFTTNDRDLAIVGSRFAGLIDSNSGKVTLMPVKTEGKDKGQPIHDQTVSAVDVSPDGKRVVTCGGNQNDTYVWDIDSGKILHRMAGAGAAIWALGWSKDGKSIAWGYQQRGEDDAKELPLEHTFRLDEFGLGGPPDPSKYTQVVVADGDAKLVLGYRRFVIETPGREPVLVAPGGPVYSATLLPGKNLVVAGGASDIFLVTPSTGKSSKATLVGHTGNVLCVTPSPDGKYFATGSNDQTIRIWRHDVEEPLLSIFVAGRDWIAWTSQGYYACSAQGERLMAWQLNSGQGTGAAAKAPQVHPAERFRSTLYKPALLKYVVPAGNLQRAMAMAVKFDKEQLDNLKNIADVFPPEVTIDGFGETEVKVEKDSITVKASAKALKAGIKSMRLLVNGRPYMGKEGVRKIEKSEPGAEATATWDVKLEHPGTYTFAVIADTGLTRGMSKIGIATRPGDPPKPNLYLLAMGVSKYPKGVNPLTYCATDAQMLAEAFPRYGKSVFNKIEVKLLTDEQATRDGIRKGMDWLKSKMTPNDVGIVSFSGHGGRDPDTETFYLIPFDINPNEPMGRSCLSGEEFKNRMDEMPGRLVAILDACHSGAVGEEVKAPPRADSLVRELTAEDSGVIVMCASLSREYSLESPLTKAGFYTLALVEGMRKHADIDGDGDIYLHELDLYATTRVRQLSQNRQNPTFSRPNSVRPFKIARPE